MLKQNHASPARNHVITLSSILLVGLLLCATARTLPAQTPSDYQAERKRAFQLMEEGNFVAALPILEKLAAANSSDAPVMRGLGFAIIINAKNLTNAEARQKERLRARTVLQRAKELGANDDLLNSVLAQIPPDGSDNEPSFSSNKEADAALREGEAAFSRGDNDKALAAYQRALQLDPKLYEAALYAGDVYFQKRDLDKAGEWYARAIAINPERETAYRYWSDALLKHSKMDEARGKAIEAILAEPYNKTAYRGLLQWAQVNKVSLGHPVIEQPKPSMRSSTEKDQTTITMDPKAFDPKQGAAYYWSFYDLTRSAYPATFTKEHPNEKAYRHSLEEEAAALRVVAEIVSKDLKEGKLKSLDDPSLANLLKLYQADLVEAYVLFVRPDEGIVRDYAAYRKTHRDKLQRYWTEFVISGGK